MRASVLKHECVGCSVHVVPSCVMSCSDSFCEALTIAAPHLRLTEPGGCWYTTRFNIRKFYVTGTVRVYVCCIWISEQTAINFPIQQ
jgi:hypothetical protein